MRLTTAWFLTTTKNTARAYVRYEFEESRAHVKFACVDNIELVALIPLLDDGFPLHNSLARYHLHHVADLLLAHVLEQEDVL